MSQSLIEITGQYRELLEAIADPTTELNASSANDTLDAIQLSFNDKAVAVSNVIRKTDTTLDAIDAEIERLRARKTVINNKKQSVIDYLKRNMAASGIKKIECPLFTITLAKGRDIVNVFDQQALPDDYLNVKTTITPDKPAIAKALKAGDEIAGARLEKSAESLRIK